MLADIEGSGALSLAAIAAELNEREIEAPRSGQWYPASVARLKDRLTSPSARERESVLLQRPGFPMDTRSRARQGNALSLHSRSE